MTVTSGFFNSQNHDRLYDAEQLSSIFDGVILDGVYQGYGDAFQVVPYEDADNTVIVKTGRAWFDHTWILNDSDFSIAIAPPNSALDRYDAIVLDIDKTLSVRKNEIKYIQGQYSSSPEYPTLIKSELHNQYPICYIQVLRGQSAPIEPQYIINKVGTSDCPLVTGVLETMDSDMFTQQMEGKFNDWFEGIKSSLEGDIALNLQNQITELKNVMDASAEYGITKEKYEFSQKAKINVALKDPYSRLLIALPDGYFVSFSCLNAQDSTDDSGQLFANLYTFDGVSTQTLTLIGSDANSVYSFDTFGRYCLCCADADTYPATLKVAVPYFIEDSSGDVTTLKLVYFTLTISEEKIMSVTSTSTDVTAKRISKLTYYGASCIPAYLNDGTRVLGVGCIDMSGSFDHSFGCMYRVTDEGVISQSVPNEESFSNSELAFAVTDNANTAVYYRGNPYSITTLEKLPYSDSTRYDAVINSLKNIKAWNNSYYLLNATQYAHCVDSYRIDQNVENVPPSISLISDISKPESSVGFISGLISQDGSVMVSHSDDYGSSGNAIYLIASNISKKGLNIWTNPTLIPNLNDIPIFDGGENSSYSLSHPYHTWSSSDSKKHLFVKDMVMKVSEPSGDPDYSQPPISFTNNKIGLVITVEMEE